MLLVNTAEGFHVCDSRGGLLRAKKRDAWSSNGFTGQEEKFEGQKAVTVRLHFWHTLSGWPHGGAISCKKTKPHAPAGVTALGLANSLPRQAGVKHLCADAEERPHVTMVAHSFTK
jgi:hypothetical protein